MRPPESNTGSVAVIVASRLVQPYFAGGPAQVRGERSEPERDEFKPLALGTPTLENSSDRRDVDLDSTVETLATFSRIYEALRTHQR